MCAAFDLRSQRALALMFDIMSQNGGISAPVEAGIRQQSGALSGTMGSIAEVARLQIIAKRRADAASPQRREDVRTRKLAIATGSGTVHGRCYDLVDQYGIELTAMRLT